MHKIILSLIKNVLLVGKNDQAAGPETFFNFVWPNIPLHI